MLLTNRGTPVAKHPLSPRHHRYRSPEPRASRLGGNQYGPTPQYEILTGLVDAVIGGIGLQNPVPVGSMVISTDLHTNMRFPQGWLSVENRIFATTTKCARDEDTIQY